MRHPDLFGYPSVQSEDARRTRLRDIDTTRHQRDFTLSQLRTALSVVLAFALGACATPPAENADAALARAAQAMGAGQLETLRYVGEGSGYTFGQAYTPGGAWPRITLHSVTRSIDYESAAMRDEIVLSRAEPKGGGGYPISGQQRNDQFVSGELAWNQTGPAASPTATPGPRFVLDRQHQLWITPQGAIKAALRQRGMASRGADGSTTVVFEQAGRPRAAIVIDPAGLVSRDDSTFPDPVLGDTAVVTSYADYRDAAANAAYFERALAPSNTLRPDRLAQSGRKAMLREVGDRLDLTDPARPIELHRIKDSVHGESFLMVYLPREKLLIEADAYTPAAAGTPPPSPANPNNLNLVDNIERLELAVDRILPLHGRVVPVAELYTAAGRTPAR